MLRMGKSIHYIIMGKVVLLYDVGEHVGSDDVGEHIGSVVERLTPVREVGGLKPSSVVLCP